MSKPQKFYLKMFYNYIDYMNYSDGDIGFDNEKLAKENFTEEEIKIVRDYVYKCEKVNEEIDYRKLLYKYLNYVGFCEGITLINDSIYQLNFENNNLNFTEKENKELMLLNGMLYYE